MADYTDSQIADLQQFIDLAQQALVAGDMQNALNDVNLHYDYQMDMRGYADDALQVVNDTGPLGVVANQELVNALGQTGYDLLMPSIAVKLATADFALVQTNHRGSLSRVSIAADDRFQSYLDDTAGGFESFGPPPTMVLVPGETMTFVNAGRSCAV